MRVQYDTIALKHGPIFFAKVFKNKFSLKGNAWRFAQYCKGYNIFFAMVVFYVSLFIAGYVMTRNTLLLCVVDMAQSPIKKISDDRENQWLSTVYFWQLDHFY